MLVGEGVGIGPDVGFDAVSAEAPRRCRVDLFGGGGDEGI